MGGVHIFTNQEIAILAWLPFAIIFIIKNKDIRESCVKLIKIAFSPGLWIIDSILLVQLLLTFVIFALFEELSFSNIKTIIFWELFELFKRVVNLNTNKEISCRKYFLEHFGFTAIRQGQRSKVVLVP
ncbi:hypothetical protein SpiGrapes_3089 [Sphaerochaeta pleomorpha str. Grapes]|uniref:Uncharacterized protein n=1 Tax=Sphaerochaeta pleomorpha (strain ATCC BAA-1885 / DSM 22778 / Grapes) TaxID=158190 RepID=G8QYX7_SPHPG|nr:hypothetical protein [Sphaerochaeta pleomorpha]AEV30836.1 hypothetical protein SpiGrapes_3089 [Sphaerochaeta pleomorpha str. Grapes]